MSPGQEGHRWRLAQQSRWLGEALGPKQGGLMFTLGPPPWGLACKGSYQPPGA